jgi:hypothetical protein
MNRFAGPECDDQLRICSYWRDAYFLAPRRSQMHFDTRFVPIPDHGVFKTVWIEVGAEFAIEPRQDIAIDGGCCESLVLRCRPILRRSRL